MHLDVFTVEAAGLQLISRKRFIRVRTRSEYHQMNFMGKLQSKDTNNGQCNRHRHTSSPSHASIALPSPSTTKSTTVRASDAGGIRTWVLHCSQPAATGIVGRHSMAARAGEKIT
jgi:hypothetical protein